MTDGVVAYVVERFPERSQTFVQNELREMAVLGVTVKVFALYPASDRDDEADDLPFVALPSAGESPVALLRAVLRQLVQRPLGLARAVALFAQRPQRLGLHSLAKAVFLLDALDALDATPSRLHAHFARASASTAMYAATALRRPFSFTAHAQDFFVRPHDMARKLRRASPPITVCDYNRRHLEARWPRTAPIAVVPCGVDADRFKRRHPYSSDPFVVVAVGRLVPKKGFHVLVEACARLRDLGVPLSCRILGDGPQRSDLEAAIVGHGLEGVVRLEGSVAPTAVVEALEGASVLCLPCIVAADGDRDSQPVVIKEAMAMELPVVASDAVGCPEMVEHGVTGLLVPSGEPGPLAEALSQLAASAMAELVEMGRRGRSRAIEEFSLRQQARGVLTCWSERSPS